MSETEPYRLRLILEAGSDTVLFADDERTKARFGYAVDAADIGVGPALRRQLRALADRWSEAAPLSSPEAGVGEILYGLEPEAAPFIAEVRALTAALRTELGKGFVIGHDFDPIPAAIGWNRAWTARAAVGGVLMTGLAGLMLYWLLTGALGRGEPFKDAVLSVMFGVFALMFVGVTITYGLASRDARPVVTVDETGLTDTRLSPDPIRWRDLESISPLQKNAHLMLCLNLKPTAHGPRFPRNPLWVLNRIGARMTGMPELTVKTNAIQATLPYLMGLVQAHAAASAEP